MPVGRLFLYDTDSFWLSISWICVIPILRFSDVSNSQISDLPNFRNTEFLDFRISNSKVLTGVASTCKTSHSTCKTSVFRLSDIPNSRFSKFSIFRFSESPIFRFPDFRFSEFPIFRISDFPNFRFFNFQSLQLSDFPNFRFSDFPIFRMSDFPKLQFSNFPIF